MTYTQLVTMLLTCGFIGSVSLLALSRPRRPRDIFKSADGALGLGFAADTARRLYLLAGPYGRKPTFLDVPNQIFSVALLLIVVLCIWARLMGRITEKQQLKEN